MTSAAPQKKSAQILENYKQARFFSSRDATKSCALWNEILNEPRFPLLTIARLRAVEVCPSIQPVSTSEPWLSELFVEASLERAKQSGDKPSELKFLTQKSESEKLQREKLTDLYRAREIAKDLHDETSEHAIKTKIQAIAPRFIENPKPDELLLVAADFKQAREFDKARAVYQKAVASDALNSFDKLKALEGIRHSYKLEKKTDEAIEAAKERAAFAEKEFLKKGLLLNKRFSTAEQGRTLLNKYFETRMVLARAVWTEGSAPEAERNLRKAEDDVHGLIPIYDSLFLRSAIQEEAGHYDQTVEILKRIDANQVASHDLRSKILWSRAWNLRRLGRLKEAEQAFTAILDQDATASRARFWLAKTEKDLSQTAQANSDFEKIITDDKISWYALLSYRELGREMPGLSPGPAHVGAPEKALMPEEKLTFEWLIAAGETELAKKFLDQIANDRKDSYSDEQTVDLLQAYARTGDYQATFARLANFSTEKRQALLDRNPELQFPQPWTPIVKEASQKFGVEAEMVYAIMRQESSFNPLSRSGADAFGLMQLIPEMATMAEKTSGLKITASEDLYVPENNIPLGTAFLHDLLQRSNQHFIAAVAGYNASEKAFARWMKVRYRGDVLTFIEDIPYEETRTYVKLVMRNYIFYKRLNSRGAPVAFPEWCLANLQDAKS